jgi:hypothetical protein
MKRPWFSLFSQTGAEIYQISKALNRFPDRIITNKSLSSINTIMLELIEEYKGSWFFLQNSLDFKTYCEAFAFDSLFYQPIITLHGYLRIIPPEVCCVYDMYNGHPGLIDPIMTDNPDLLKGKDPQKKVYDLKLDESGCVIHKVTSKVDEGEIVSAKRVSIKDRSLDDVYAILHDTSVELWVNFLKGELK